jgi:hypothetical protein
MADFVNTIDLLGDELTAKVIIERTITEYNDDTISLVGDYAFHYCSALTSVDLPNATSSGNYAFNGCSALASVSLPSLTSIGQYAFSHCSALTSAYFPSVTRIGNYAFYFCSALASVILPSVTNIGQATFSWCSNLKVLVLGSKTLCPLTNKSTFNQTPFAEGKAGGTVYVPQALITEYQTATNWSTLYAAGTCNFVAIEGSEYE